MNRKIKSLPLKMESPRKTKQEDLEVTGVSRSGRVRKKSSKLMDFESPDEIDIKFNRKKEKQEFATPQSSRQPKKPPPAFQIKQEDLLLEAELGRPFNLKDDSEEESDVAAFPQDESSYDSFDEELNDVELSQDTEGFQAIANDSSDDLAPSQPLYMGESDAKKKLVIKDGKIMKAQRKDKGKARFTPYLLWCKEMRNELHKTHPGLDFTQINRKLGRMWSSVPMNEKYIWKRRAKRMATKAEMEAESVRKSNVNKSRSPQRKFISKPAPPARQAVSSVNVQPISNFESTRANTKVNLLMDANSSVFKQVATTPLDVAAHLKLLGESLTIIGERLTEHEGQIAVSGSFSLLLDSLLCALVPLMCLTQQVPELNCIPQDILSHSMDNVAYIMPGF